MMRTPQGEAEVERLFRACFAGMMPPVFSRYVETILDHEYGPATTE